MIPVYVVTKHVWATLSTVCSLMMKSLSQSEPDQSKWSNWHRPKVGLITSRCSFNHNISQDQWYRYDIWHNDCHLDLIINLIYGYCSSKYTRTCLCHLLTAAIVIPISPPHDVHSTKTIHKIAFLKRFAATCLLNILILIVLVCSCTKFQSWVPRYVWLLLVYCLL